MKLSFSKINLLAVAVLISFSFVNCGCPDGWGTIDNVNGFKVFTSTDPINLFMVIFSIMIVRESLVLTRTLRSGISR